MTWLETLVARDQHLSARLVIPPEARWRRLLALVAAHSGDSPLWLAGAAIALIWGEAFWQGLGGRVLIGTLLAGGATTVLKWVFQRQRPPGESFGFYSRYDRHAFPSGHAARTACLAVLLAPLLPPSTWVLWLVWVGLVGLARVGLQVHFLSDIAAGWLVGLLIGLGLTIFFL
jgi:undecaprenyl-diphosphatase